MLAKIKTEEEIEEGDVMILHIRSSKAHLFDIKTGKAIYLGE